MKTERIKIVAVRLPVEIYEKLAKLAENEGLRVSQVIRKIIVKTIKEMGL